MTGLSNDLTLCRLVRLDFFCVFSGSVENCFVKMELALPRPTAGTWTVAELHCELQRPERR